MRAQAMVELSICLPILLTLTIGIICLGITEWRVSDASHALSDLATELPDGWQTLPADELVRSLVLDGSSLDAERLTVTNASVREVRTSDVDASGALAVALGGTFKVSESTWLVVSADVSYDLGGATAWPTDPGVWSRHVERRYLVSTREEVG